MSAPARRAGQASPAPARPPLPTHASSLGSEAPWSEVGSQLGSLHADDPRLLDEAERVLAEQGAWAALDGDDDASAAAEALLVPQKRTQASPRVLSPMPAAGEAGDALSAYFGAPAADDGWDAVGAPAPPHAPPAAFHAPPPPQPPPPAAPAAVQPPAAPAEGAFAYFDQGGAEDLFLPAAAAGGAADAAPAAVAPQYEAVHAAQHDYSHANGDQGAWAAAQYANGDQGAWATEHVHADGTQGWAAEPMQANGDQGTWAAEPMQANGDQGAWAAEPVQANGDQGAWAAEPVQANGVHGYGAWAEPQQANGVHAWATSEPVPAEAVAAAQQLVHDPLMDESEPIFTAGGDADARYRARPSDILNELGVLAADDGENSSALQDEPLVNSGGHAAGVVAMDAFAGRNVTAPEEPQLNAYFGAQPADADWLGTGAPAVDQQPPPWAQTSSAGAPHAATAPAPPAPSADQWSSASSATEPAWGGQAGASPPPAAPHMPQAPGGPSPWAPQGAVPVPQAAAPGAMPAQQQPAWAPRAAPQPMGWPPRAPPTQQQPVSAAAVPGAGAAVPRPDGLQRAPQHQWQQAAAPPPQPQQSHAVAPAAAAAARPVFRPRPAHPLVSFGFGGRLLVMYPRRKRTLNVFERAPSPTVSQSEDEPCLPGVVRIHDVRTLIAGSAFARSLASFPGPLGATGGERLQRFLQEQRAADGASAAAGAASEAAHVLWDVLQLMCAPPAEQPAGAGALGPAFGRAVVDVLLRGVAVPAPVPAAAVVDASPPDVQRHAVEEIQRLLLQGKCAEAGEVAVQNQLWAHAMLLASFGDPATYHHVVSQFALRSFADGSPLQSLYLVFAHSPKALFRGVHEEQQTRDTGVVAARPQPPPLVAHWRTNAAVLVANRTPNDSVVLTQLGDALLATGGPVCAAHVCYLLADQRVGEGRLPLIGADPRNMRTFVSPAAVQRTELYELAKRRANPQFSVPPFQARTRSLCCAATEPARAAQAFKFAYACMLADAGLVGVAAAYVAAIKTTIKDTKKQFQYSAALLRGMAELEERLQNAESERARGAGVVRKLTGGLFGLMGKTLDLFVGGEAPKEAQEQQAQRPQPPSQPQLSASESMTELEERRHGATSAGAGGTHGAGGGGAGTGGGGGLRDVDLRPSDPAPPGPTEPAARGKSQPTTPATGSGLSLLGGLGSWFARKSNVREASLEQDHQIVVRDGRYIFVDKHGKEVPAGQEEEERRRQAAPPAISADLRARLEAQQQQSAPPVSSAPGAAPGALPARPGAPPSGSVFARSGHGVTSRYALGLGADLIAAPAAAPAAPVSVAPRPAPGGFKVFQPRMPAPGEAEAPPPVDAAPPAVESAPVYAPPLHASPPQPQPAVAAAPPAASQPAPSAAHPGPPPPSAAPVSGAPPPWMSFRPNAAARLPGAPSAAGARGPPSAPPGRVPPPYVRAYPGLQQQ